MAATAITDMRTVGIGVGDQDATLGSYLGTLGSETRFDPQTGPEARWIALRGATASITPDFAERPDGNDDYTVEEHR